MKEAVIYDMYQYLGADASLYNYAEISVNQDSLSGNMSHNYYLYENNGTKQ